MSYTDDRFDTRTIVYGAIARNLGTATADGADDFALSGTDILVKLPKFWRRCKVTGGRMIVTTIPNADATGLVASFLNGTDTFATVTLTTATAGAVLDLALTTAYCTFTAGAQPTIVTAGTSTASGDTAGNYDIYFEVQELFA